MRPQFIAIVELCCIVACAAGIRGDEAAVIRVEPTEVVFSGMLDRVQLVVSAVGGADARTTDATAVAKYESLSPDVASISAGGRMTPHANGAAVVRVTCGTATIDVRVNVNVGESAHPVSFTADVIPVLTKAGCNQGACHGAQFGQGSFKLSLLGFAPEQDYPSIVRD